MSLSLSCLGLELENIRRARRGDDPDVSPVQTSRPLPIPAAATDSPASTTCSLPSSSPAASTSTSTSSTASDSSCLLCLSRAPSAVLLPCCHLNICHLCAPLLMLKASNDAASREYTTSNQDRLLEEPDHIPFNVALARAVKGNSKSRRLSNGGFVAQRGCGGEFNGRDLFNGSMKRIHQDDGRMVLESVDEGVGGASAATCLVCRASVSGWLRVYS